MLHYKPSSEYIGAKYRGIRKVVSKNPIVSLLPLPINVTCSFWSGSTVNYSRQSITTNIELACYKVEHDLVLIVILK